MKRKLIKMLLMVTLMSFTVNNTYSYNLLGKILKPKSDKEATNTDNSNRSDKVREKRTVNNSAGSIVLDSEYDSVGQNYRERFIILHYTALNREK